ncbi:uncharacterized protein LOC664490 [Tribolium castaneum]|uniref:Solute carrier family 46 member 3-like Protein n=1 Tax=Tribolium castaneum TaxID=7070 RepID=D6WRL5_TRICA|nr:PREDICTED: uncharacterized protein LOC664490 [Tribolium castaneum]EFA05975.2 Solute carrier family 46 member 3-like Protein [Tribolium castaneum]|eukprot:XP_975585.1 PREDICTED: uncharacterized protein LOC664490 [Tribolium castaneum]
MASTAELVTASVADLQPKTFRTMTTKERLHYIKNIITVEPLIAAYLLASIICGPALYNLEFEKGCRSNLQLNDSICDAILSGEATNYSEENEKIQILIGDMHSWQIPLQSVMPLILVLFLGSYSDRHKLRKPFLLIPVLGEFFAVAGCILCVVFMKEWPLASQGIAQTVIPSFFGGQTMIVMAVFAYIADVSTVEMRTLRVGVVQIVLNVCTPVGQAVSGILFEKIGYYGVLSIAVVCYLFAILYGIFWIKEPHQPDVISKKSFFVDAFDPKHAVETFNLLFKKSKGNNRAFVVAVLFILFIYSIVVTGEGGVFYLYVQGFFNWGPLEYSYFITINTVIHLVGTLIGVPLFTKFLSLGDLMILLITFVDKIVTNIVFGLAKTDVMLYVATAVSIITGISNIAIRSLATKVVSQEDLGKAQSLFGICEAIGPAIAAPLYNKAIYLNSLDTLPSAYFYFGAILHVLLLVVIIWMYYASKSEEKGDIEKEQPNNANEKVSEEFQMTHI